jgi:hypothetical protein
MIEYASVLAGSAGSIILTYLGYCNYTFHKELKGTLVERQVKNNNDRTKTLTDVFQDDGVHLTHPRTAVQPRSGISPERWGTFFLKPTIGITKICLYLGLYNSKN